MAEANADDQNRISEEEEHQRRARERLALEFGKRTEFDDPKHEWRRLFSGSSVPSSSCSSAPAARW